MVAVRVLLGVAGIVLCSVAGAAEGPRYLTSVRGPYTGRATDAATGKPVPRALVLIVWQSEDDEVDGMKNLVGIREAATEPDGTFRIQAPFEAAVPARTLPPAVYAFAHGYLPFPENPYTGGAAAEEFRGGGRLIALSPASTDEDRARTFNALFTLPNRWAGRGPAPGSPPQPPLLLLEAFLGEQLESHGFREQGGVWRPVNPR